MKKDLAFTIGHHRKNNRVPIVAYLYKNIQK